MKATLVWSALLLLIFPFTGKLENSNRQSGEISNWDPSWSPDGTSIAFTSDRSGNKDLWTMTSDGRNLTNLTAQDSLVEFSPKWSPDGRSIAYAAHSPGTPYNLDIWLIQLDDGSRASLTAPLTGDRAVSNDVPAWSPDGTQIVFSSDDTSFSRIVVFNLRDSTFTTLAQSDDRNFYRPLWSPDGKLIAFVAYGDHPGLWVTTTGGKNLREIITGEVRDFSWSPDGTALVFSLIQDSSYENLDIDLMVIELSSLEVVNLMDNFPGYGVEAAWSPTGGQIIFMGTVDGIEDIWKINEDGTNPVHLTSDEAKDWIPTWSPDGSRIAFMSDRAGPLDIWVMNADGSNPVNLTGAR
jgi:Tol biopolymer transport system component